MSGRTETMNFEVLVAKLRPILFSMSEEIRGSRIKFLSYTKLLWDTCSLDEQLEWLAKIDAFQRAVQVGRLRGSKALLNAVDDMFMRPARRGEARLVTLHDLMLIAEANWDAFSNLKSPSDYDLFTELKERSAASAVTAMQVVTNYRWAEAGYPVVKISPKFAAAAACTKALPEVLSELRPPWRGFAIEMPSEPVLYQSSGGRVVAVKYILVSWTENYCDETRDCNWSFYCLSELDGLSTNRTRTKSSNLCEIWRGEVDDDVLPWHEMSGQDNRLLQLAGRILVSTICALDNKDQVVRVGHRQSRPLNHRESDVPEARIFQVTAPIEIDLVKVVRDCQLADGEARKRWSLNVQMMVVGHHKMQVCGKRRLERKYLWIKPYWRGPSDAPIAVRPHVLKDEPRGASR
jgi:hypothetical protein